MNLLYFYDFCHFKVFINGIKIVCNLLGLALFLLSKVLWGSSKFCVLLLFFTLYTHSFCSEPFENKLTRHHAYLHINISILFPSKNKDIHLQNYFVAKKKVRKFTLIICYLCSYLICRPYWNLTKCPNSVLCSIFREGESRIQSRIYIVFSFHVFMLS